MNVVQAGHEDVPAIHELIHQTISTIYPKYYPTDVVRFFLDYHSKDHIAKALDQELVLLINEEDQLIGTGSLLGNEIKRMFVLPEFHNKGYGSLLLNKLEQKAVENGCTSVELDSSLPAYGLYERKGYLPIKNERIVTQSGQVLFYHRMAKRIGIRNKNRLEQHHYYSDRLQNKLKKLCHARAAIIEAPSGYGKTTALRDFLESGPAQNALVYWFTAANEPSPVGFRRLCLIIDKIDSGAGKRLLKMELPNAINIGEACEALRAIRCRQQTYLVIDNFQLVQTALPHPFLTALLGHGGEGLHVIIVTQPLNPLKPHLLEAIAGLDFLHITSADLRLNAVDIQRYYNQADLGLTITLKEAQRIEGYTEGWIIAVNLQLRAFGENGTFLEKPGIMTLMEHLVWDKLTEAQQTFLLRLSPFETVTTRQICDLAGWNRLPEHARDSLNNPFIRYEPVKRCYELHGILSELLKIKRSERGAAFERECLARAGDFCRNEGDIVKAFDFYYRIGDYEQMLSLDLSRLAFRMIGTTPFVELARNIAMNCPAEIKKKHPLSMLRIAWALLNAGMNAEFEGLMEEVSLMMKTGGDEETSHILGEWTLLSSFKSFPRLEEMVAVLKEAERAFNGKCSLVILPTIPWWFGSFFPFAEFHTQPGQADREADLFEEYITLYAKLTGGHGSGADALFRSDLAYHRGNLNDAEICAYKAVYFAECNRQSTVLLGAAMRLAEIALHKADAARWQRAIDSMERATSFDAQDTSMVRSAIDIVRGILLNELQNQKNIADWLKDGDFSGEQLPPSMASNALFVHLSYLMHQAEYARLVGTAQAIYPDGFSAQPLRDMVFSLTVAVGELELNNRVKAATLVERAARAALPDGLLFLFVSYTWLLGGLTEDLVAREYPALLGRFNDIKKRFKQGWTTLRQFIFLIGLSPALSPREYEVARLAAEGLHNDEIAARLTVSENTVRAHLRVIFQKLDIDRRAKLAEKLK